MGYITYNKDIETALECLCKIQSLYKNIYDKNDRLNLYKNNYTKIQSEYSIIEEHLKTYKTSIQTLNKVIESNKDEYNKINTQLSESSDRETQVKTQKEYENIEVEINKISERKILLETDIKKKSSELEILSDKTKNKNNDLSALKLKLERVNSDIISLTSELNRELENITSIKKGFIAKKLITYRLLDKFKHIADNKNGVGISKCYNNICQGCNIQLSCKIVNMISDFENIILCYNCRRILYI